MIPIESTLISSSIKNPDTLAIQRKSYVDISVSEFDISSSISGSTVIPTIQLNRNNLEIVLLDDENVDEFDAYYTPLYTEKINYKIWKTTINKTFQELEIG